MKLKMLVVNDEPFQLMVIQRILSEIRDIEFVTAINGDQAVREIQKNMSEFQEYNSNQ